MSDLRRKYEKAICAVCPVLGFDVVFAQSDSPPAGAANRLITLDVVVADQSGHAVPGLQRQDFQLMDNKLAQKIVSFRAVAGTPATDHRPLEVILVVDEVNTSFSTSSDCAPGNRKVSESKRRRDSAQHGFFPVFSEGVVAAAPESE